MQTGAEILLIHPPVVRPCEPPAGIARLAGALRHNGITVKVLDANIEGLLYLIGGGFPRTGQAGDRWSVGAWKRRELNLAVLRSGRGFENLDRYARAVRDLGRVLQTAGVSGDVRVGLADYRDERRSPLRSADLGWAACHPERNPFYPYFAGRLAGLAARHSPVVVGFSLNYLSQGLCTFAMIGYLRRLLPQVRIVLGGGLVSAWMSQTDWRSPWGGLVDEMVAGPGEERLAALMGEESCRPDAAPHYSDFPLADYLAPGLILPYSASEGCYWGRCAFCPETAQGNAYVPLSPSRVGAEVARLCGQHATRLVHFLDNALSPALLEWLCENPLGVPWYGFARVTEQLADEDFCRSLKRSGCTMLQLGIESGDQRVLDELNKGLNLETASLALKALKRAGIASYVYLLFGTPQETHAAARMTLDFTVRHAGAIGFLNLAIFNLPAHSPLAGNLETGAFYEGDLSLCSSFAHPEGWDRAAVRVFLEREFRCHPAIRPIIGRDPPVFTSNHAPFFTGMRG